MSLRTSHRRPYAPGGGRAWHRRLAPLSDDLVLLDSGLDSLCFAIVVAKLEDELGEDPFATSEDIDFPITFGDFVRFYDRVPA